MFEFSRSSSITYFKNRLRKQLFKPRAVKANDNFTVNDNDRCRQDTQSFQFFDSRTVFGNILFRKSHASLRKELLRLATKDSARLTVQSNFLVHQTSFSPPCNAACEIHLISVSPIELSLSNLFFSFSRSFFLGSFSGALAASSKRLSKASSDSRIAALK